MQKSFLRNQKLSPKQKAILLFWQKTKGIYIPDNSKEIVKVEQTKYVSPFTDNEINTMVDFPSTGELLEYYMWTHILDAILLFDSLAQGHYFEMSSYIQIVTFGFPCSISEKMMWPKYAGHDHKYFSWSDNKVMGHEEGLSRYHFSIDQFFSNIISAILINLYIDEVASPLLSERYPTKAFSFDIKMDQIIRSTENQARYFLNGEYHYFVKNYYKGKENSWIKQSEEITRSLFQPLSVFNHQLDSDKLISCKNKTLEIMDQAMQKATLDSV